MIQSKVESAFEQDVFQPSMTEFANFSKYITTLEKGDLSFALVSFVISCLVIIFQHFFTII